MTVRKFQELPVWQAACRLEKAVFESTGKGEFRNDWKLCGQIRDATASIMANIAEGFSRRYDREFIQFLFHAKSSAAEVQSHLHVALSRDHVDRTTFQRVFDLADMVARQLSGLISYLSGHKPRRTRAMPTLQSQTQVIE